MIGIAAVASQGHQALWRGKGGEEGPGFVFEGGADFSAHLKGCVLLPDTFQPNKESVVSRRVFNAAEATRLATVTGGHVRFQNEHIVIGF